LQQILGSSFPNSHFKIIDEKAHLKTIDVEVGNYLFLPSNASVEGNHMRKLKGTNYGDVFLAERPGIVRTFLARENGYFIRIQNAGYVGLAEYRHLEDKSEEL
jgi:hypothetical protein